MPVYKSTEPTKDGRSWYYRCFYDDAFGERKQKKSMKYSLKSEALEAERIFLLNKVNNDHKSYTFYDAYLYLINNKDNQYKNTTIHQYKCRSNYFKPLFKTKLKSLSVKNIETWKEYINFCKLSLNTKNTLLSNVQSIISKFITKNNITISFNIKNIELFKDPNQIKKKMDIYTYDQFKKFISNEKELNYQVLFETLYFCGLRIGELRALNWNDIDFKNKIINISKQIPSGYKTITSPKTSAGVRQIPIPNFLFNHIEQLYHYYSTFYCFDNNWFVFGGNKPISLNDVRLENIKLAKLSKLKKINIHSFRHSCASLLINNNANITIIAQYMGHSNITTTLNTYSHMFTSTLNEVVDKINKLN